ncbi:Hypothetical predicted protein [Marmota monax]|uniref:Uncharacterized protein n=1 Tax=Marmota monax TaxID=9995 RepID=A0A5E4A3N3_MARMO|nr:Hypothetical predicted protein [Marmota monax]
MDPLASIQLSALGPKAKFPNSKMMSSGFQEAMSLEAPVSLRGTPPGCPKYLCKPQDRTDAGRPSVWRPWIGSFFTTLLENSGQSGTGSSTIFVVLKTSPGNECHL